jgi:hypothetical protein
MHAQPTRRSYLEGWSWALSAQLVQLIVQALSIALLARVLSVTDLGLLVSLTAITSILALKILITMRIWPPTEERRSWCVNLACEFSRQGHQVMVYCPEAGAVADAEFEALAAYLHKPGFDDRVEWERQQLKKLKSIPLVGDNIFRLTRRVLRRWTGSFGLH